MTKTEMQQRLKNIQQEAKELEESIGELDSKQGRWKPEEYATFYYVASYSAIESTMWGEDDVFCKGHYLIGNVFEIEEEAELHKLRLESMANRWRPEVGEEFYYWDFYFSQARVSTFRGVYYPEYWIGNCHKTEADAKAWGKKYAKAFSLDTK